MGIRQRLRSPRLLLASFLTVALTLGGALAWLSWRLLDQDRRLADQQVHERLEATAEVAASVLANSLTEIQDEIRRFAELPEDELRNAIERRTDGLRIAVFLPEGVELSSLVSLPYYPYVSSASAPEGAFAAGEALEFRDRDYGRAAAIFKDLAGDEDLSVRGGALLRLARNLRKAGQREEALTVYEELASLGKTIVEGRPAELWARYERCVLLEEMGEVSTFQNEARALYRDLHTGPWPVTRSVFDFYADATRPWLSSETLAETALSEEYLALADAVEWAWQAWRKESSARMEAVGWQNVSTRSGSAFSMWQPGPNRLVVLVATMDDLERVLHDRLFSLAESLNASVRITPRDQNLVRDEENSAFSFLKTGVETGLPWNLHVRSRDSTSVLAELQARRQLLVTVLGLIAAFVVVGGYFGVRAVSQELETAKLQSDFVSAVSHEFRSPLASMRQLSEMLVDGRVPSEESRQQYYVQLNSESERLMRLVEGLLDFGRMEAGVREYQRETLDAAELVRAVGREFSREGRDHGFEVVVDSGETACVHGDREALQVAVSNLLENAIKYSAHSRTVWLESRLRDNEVRIDVRDKGVGIPASEQKRIFRKFVRAPQSSTDGVPGTGLGLALVEEIVRAHQGHVELDSAPGKGSTFTIVLPLAEVA